MKALVTALLVMLFAVPARAEVTIAFYSHNLRLLDGLSTDFPHGFVLLSGTTGDGAPVKANLGFSATNIFINVLWEKVHGSMDESPLPDGYVEDATRHFAFPLSDAQYRAVVAVAERWRSAPQPSYDIDTSNCVIFVKEIAIAAGLAVSDDVKFVRKPREFLEDAAMRNASFLAQFGTTSPQPALTERVRQLDRAAGQ